MPTIIDEFVIQLGLDPKNFTEGQRRLQDNLRDLERDTNRTGQNIEGNIGRGVNSIFSLFSKPLAETHKSFADLAAESRRFGSAVASGAGIGAAGLGAMAAAGTAAFASIQAVHDLMQKLSTTMNSTAAAGRVSAMTGVSPQFMTTFAAAANVATNANMEQTMSQMFGVRQMIERLHSGQGYDPILQQLATYAGVTDLESGTPEQSMQRLLTGIASAGQRMTQPEFQAKFGGVFSPEVLQFLQRGPAGVQQAMREVSQFGTTKEQAETMGRLQTATNKLEIAFTSLVRIFEVWAAPGLISAMTGWTAFIEVLEKDPAKALRGFVAAVTEAGVDFVKAIVDIPVHIIAAIASAMGLTNDQGGPITGIGGDDSAYGRMKSWINRRFGGGGGDSAATGGGSSTSAGSNQYAGQGNEFLKNQRAASAAEIANTPGLQDQVLAMASMEDARDPAGPLESLFNRAAYTHQSINQLLNSGFYSGIKHGRMPEFLAKLNSNPQLKARMQAGLDAVIAGSNRLKGATDQGQTGDPNAPGSPGGTTSGLIFPPGATPGAIYNDWGGGPGGHAGAAAWRQEQQSHVNGSSATTPTPSSTRNSTFVPDPGGPQNVHGGGVPPWIKRNSKGEPISDEVAAGAANTKIPDATWHSFLVQNANASNVSNSSSTNNSSTSVHVDKIIVPPAADPAATGGAIGGALKNQFLSSSTNTGITP